MTPTALPLEIVHASEVISMDDVAGKALRAKRDSSIRVAGPGWCTTGKPTA